MVVKLGWEPTFPDPRNGEPDGLFAFGGDLSVRRLTEAYKQGIFPFYAFRYDLTILWYCPLDRFVIFVDEIHVSHSMRNIFNSNKFHVTFNQDFSSVIEQCSRLRYDEKYAWLGDDMIRAYKRLAQNGNAKSVEVWNVDNQLVGGLYGVVYNRCFFGESMFSLVPSASKIALIELARKMQLENGKFIDCQFETPHLKSMGGRHISYEEYLSIVNER